MNHAEIIAANPITEFVRSRGHELKRSGENFVTSGCPVTRHKNEHRPVTVYPRTQSWSCHDCKKNGSVIDWLMFEKNIGVAEAMTELGGGKESKIVKTYDYVDENGNLLFQCCRKEPKDFCQRRPGDRDRYVYNLKGVRRVLYRLPEVIKAQTVCLVEGEKDADNLCALGFIATTNPMGAGKWRNEYAETLRGKDVIVFGDVGDANGAGEKHTAQVLASLTGKAKSLKHVTLPDGFHDISDCIASLKREQEPREAIAHIIWRLIKETPLLVKKAQSTDKSETENAAEDEAIRCLAKMSLLDYEKVRKDEAKKLHCRPSTLDRLVNTQRLVMRPPSETAALQGEIVNLTDVEPWPEPVNGAEILDAISERFRRYMVLPDGAADAATLWCAHTHAYKFFQISPRLGVVSPMHECGKTTLRDCATLFCSRAVSTDNMSPAVMFRLVSRHSPTILADECDKWLFLDEELVGLMCSGHRKSGSAMRCEGESNELRRFGCYAPVLLATIGALPAQIHSRSIIVRLKRATRQEIQACSRFDAEHVEIENELCRKLARWIADNAERIATCNPALPENLFNRLSDNWRPLFVIGEVAGCDWPERCAKALVKLTAPEDDDESLRVMLLADIRQVFAAERMFSRELRDLLADMDERPWPEVCRGGKPITERWLARNLAAFDIRPKSMRIGEGNAKGYARADFDDVFARYLDVVTDTSVTDSHPVTDEETKISIGKTDVCDGVTAKKPKKSPHSEFLPEGTSTL